MKETSKSNEELIPIVRRFVEDAGTMTQSLGLGRVVGQIYGYLYFSQNARSLSDMQEALGISKGSASTGVRQLEQWSAVRKVWVKGDRKDYYEANDWLGQILKNIFVDTVGKKLEVYAARIREAEAELSTSQNDGDHARFVRERVAKLHDFQAKAQGLWNNPLVRVLVK